MKTLALSAYSRYLPLLGAALIFSYIAVIQYNQLSETRHFVQNTQTSTQAATSSKQQAAGKVSDLNLFGKNTAPIMSQPNSKIKISGIFLAIPENESTVALIVDNDSEKIYKIGDRIKGDGQITRITEEYILVMQNGRNTKYPLVMQDNSATSSAINTGPRTGWEPEPSALPNNNNQYNTPTDTDDDIETEVGTDVDSAVSTAPTYTPPAVVPGQLPNGYQNDPRMHQYFQNKARLRGGF